MPPSFTDVLFRWRWLVLLVTVALAVAAGSGARLLRFDTDYRIFFSADNPQMLAFENLQDTYTKNDNVLFVLAPADGDVFSPPFLKIVQDLTHDAWQIPYSLRVDSITNFQHVRAEGDDLSVADLVEDPTTLDAAGLANIRAIALNEPRLRHNLIAPSADVTGVNVTIQLPGKDQAQEVPEVARFVERMANQLRAAHPDLTVHLTGMTMMNNAFPAAAKRDMGTLVPIMFLAVIVMIWIMTRSFYATLGTVLVILFSIATAMGLTGWLGIALTGPSSSAPTIILTMAVADCIHILVSFLFVLRTQGDNDTRKAMAESLRINFQPILLTSVTTAVGFLSMNLGDVPPFRDLGNIVTMGVLAAYFYAITFLPALMMVLPVRAKAATTTTGQTMDRFATFVIRRRRGLLWGMSTMVVVLVACVPNNDLNDEFVKYFSHNVDFRVATDFSSERLTGIYRIDYSLESGSTNGVADPDFLERVDALTQWYRQQPEVDHVHTITDVFKRLNRTMHGDDPAWYRLPEARDLAAQYLLFYEMSLPYGLDLNNQINLDKSATRFSVTVHNLSTNDFLAVVERARRWMQHHLPPVMHAEAASPTIMFSHIGKRNIHSMLWGTILALVLISLILMLSLRSFKVGLISLIPNLVPVAMAFGLWGILVGEVGLALSVVAGMTLGIVVDDTVHFLSKYLRARREERLSSPEAVRYAFRTVGSALIATSSILVCGFFVLTFSDFRLNSGMGMMTAITIVLALVADFLLLPPILMKLEKQT